MTEKIAPREGYAQGLIELGENHPEVVVLDADCAKANLTDRFQAHFPERFFNMGIAECDLVGTGAGMSLLGKVPFVNAYANFLTGRGFDQVRVSVAYSGRPVKVVGHNAGTSAAQEGATHLPLEDIGLMRAIPEMTVIVPADSIEMKKAVLSAYAFDGPVYLRVGKLPVPVVTDDDTPFEIGKAVKIREGNDITLASTGCVLSEVVQAAELLAEQGVDAEILHFHTVKPIDVDVLVESARKTRGVVTIEEHSILNGLGSAVAETLSETCPVRLSRIGTMDVFGLSGTMDELFDYFGLRAQNIVEHAQSVIDQKDKQR